MVKDSPLNTSWIFAFFLLTGFLTHGLDQRTVVLTTKGPVRGKTIHREDSLVKAWLGIPFASPPIGPLRFRPPVEIEPWSSVRDAVDHPPGCYQTDDTSYSVVPTFSLWNPTNMSEDCLYLNVYSPWETDGVSEYPTVVWIHGGAYYKGAISLDMYDPEVLVARHKVVVVSIQYRVAALGFLYLGNDEAPGNVGLLDQVMALQWVQSNIHKFKGSSKVTLMGESAGSASVAYHMMSKGSWGLFDRAIMQSGSPHSPWGYVDPEESLQITQYFADNAGCSSSNKIDIDCLRAIPPDELLAKDQSILYFAPTIDGHFLPEDPREIAERGDLKPTRILAGLVQNEGMPALEYMLSKLYTANYLHFSDLDYMATTYLLRQYLQVSNDNLTYLSDFYLDQYSGLAGHNYLSAAIGLVGDWLVSCGLVDFIYSSADVGCDVYFYYFNHRSTRSRVQNYTGVMHGDELPYQFGIPWLRPGQYSNDDREVSDFVMQTWMDFVKLGYPSADPDIKWEAYSRKNPYYKLIEGNEEVNVLVPRESFCDKWTELRPYIKTIKTKDIFWFKLNMGGLIATRKISGMLNWLSSNYQHLKSFLNSNLLSQVL